MAPTVRIVTTAADLQTLADAWQTLSDDGAGDPLFGSFAWNATWWKHYQHLGKLRVFVAERDGVVAGIWPLFLANRTFGQVEIDMVGDRKMPAPGKGLPVRALAYLGSGEICSDFLQPLVRPGDEEPILDAMVAHLAQTRDWDLLDLCDTPAAGPVLPALRSALKKHLAAPRERFRYVAPYTALPGDYDAYLQTLTKKSRENARKKRRQLALNHTVTHTVHDDPATLREALDTLIALHQERWNADGLPGVFVNEHFIGFHHEMAAQGLERGWLRLGLLRVNDPVVFATYAYQVGDRVYLYQQGGSADPHWNRYNLGFVALGHAIEDACAHGAAEYDFLRGDAPYKGHWAREKRDLIQLQVARGVRGKAFMLHSMLNTDPELRAKVKSLVGKK